MNTFSRLINMQLKRKFKSLIKFTDLNLPTFHFRMTQIMAFRLKIIVLYVINDKNRYTLLAECW